MPIKIAEYLVSLDTYEKGADANFVSHAHADHMSGIRKHKPCIASSATMDIIEAKKGKGFSAMPVPKQAKMLNSGHMLGAKQLYIDSDHYGARILYSGDYQMQRSPVAEPIETINADVLIIDSTYPYPNIEFEDKEKVISAMHAYAREKLRKGPIIFGAFATSKAQEIIKIFNYIGIVPFASKAVCSINKIYEKNGIRLDYEPINTNSIARNGIFVVENSRAEELRLALSKNFTKVFTAAASGFAKFIRFNTDAQFTLSDHADFKQAIRYIGRVAPKVIYTCGPSSEVFAKNLRAYGKNAFSIGSRSGVNELILYNTDMQQ